MAYYSGQASSYQELRNVLANACVAAGWTWSDGILSKNAAYIKLTATDALGWGHGLQIWGGTGKSGSDLVNPCPSAHRIGALGHDPTMIPHVSFPCDYFIFAFDQPVDEIYLIIKYAIDRYMFLSFGLSSLNVGFWLCATVSNAYNTNWWNASEMFRSFTIQSDGTYGNQHTDGTSTVATGFLWQTRSYNNNGSACTSAYLTLNQSWITSIGNDWGTNKISAISSVAPLIANQPSLWSANSALIPIQLNVEFPQAKRVLISEIQNARYLRIDNYEPEQIITLGNDKWKVFPFHKKNLAQRNGGEPIDHSGTFGWAIRYEEP
ncbi:hypothetical protein [Acinetobacter nematophilus]|uniref:Virion structural protein n=1 Tax=Acinetobacter nematophilus TaxID=2994642 RepID=A0A9X3DQ78_9GAMM|nr:hypothetical protein [Acinetobacter nematophilus]MCX5466489.1 hypothetical protein [Acinetobacter nematophilus]